MLDKTNQDHFFREVVCLHLLNLIRGEKEMLNKDVNQI
jgi:hypothetical protein